MSHSSDVTEALAQLAGKTIQAVRLVDSDEIDRASRTEEDFVRLELLTTDGYAVAVETQDAECYRSWLVLGDRPTGV